MVFLCHLLIERLLLSIGSGLNACKLLKHLLHLLGNTEALSFAGCDALL